MATVDLTSLVLKLQEFGVLDVMLPFFLVFAVLFAVLQKIKLFGDEKKSINVMVALIISILTVVPHITGNYPGQYDPVVILNTLMPSVGVLSVGIILILLLWGMFGQEWMGGSIIPILVLGVLGVLIYIFGATVGWWADPTQSFGWWGSDFTTLIIIILVFGLIVWFITAEKPKSSGEGLLAFVEKLMKKPK